MRKEDIIDLVKIVMIIIHITLIMYFMTNYEQTLKFVCIEIFMILHFFSIVFYEEIRNFAVKNFLKKQEKKRKEYSVTKRGYILKCELCTEKFVHYKVPGSEDGPICPNCGHTEMFEMLGREKSGDD